MGSRYLSDLQVHMSIWTCDSGQLYSYSYDVRVVKPRHILAKIRDMYNMHKDPRR